ncbi:hypothetical protein BH23GEM10_BH23GEM10_09580 [soil metagenome]
MKMILPFALLFVSATAVQAQEPVKTAPVDPTPVVAPTLTQQAPIDLDAPIVPALQADAETDRAVTTTDRVNAESSTSDAPAAAVQNTPRNWWWLVGALVLAGVILAVLL